MITIKKLTKKFGDNLVLDNISLEIKQGEIVGLLGPNGVGKTTTMRILTNFLTPTSGKVLINEEAVNNDDQAIKLRKYIGYLPEDNPLYPEMLVYEYLKMMAELKQVKKEKINNEVKKVVIKTGLESVYYKQILNLSKGFKQRVGLAASILNDPKILILDEPTEGLDPNQRVDIRNLIQNLGQDKTVIISSHVLSEIEHTCNRVIIINNGRIVANDKMENIIANVKGSKELNIEIEGVGVKEKIRQIFGDEIIKNIKQKENRIKFDIEAKANEELRPSIFNLVKNNNWILWEMHQQKTTLEDVFKKLTK